MRRKRTQLRRSLSKYVPNSIKRIKHRVNRAVRSGLGELYRPIHAYRYRTYPKVLQTSIPKSGTHLLMMALEGIGYRVYKHQPFNPYINVNYAPSDIQPHLSRVLSGEYFTEHLTWKEKCEKILLNSNFKIVFIYRDPRATAISWCHHLVKGTRLPFRHYLRELPDLKSRIVATLEGIPDECSRNGVGMCSWPALYDLFLPWKKSPAVFSVSFEELVGSKGGGSDEEQLHTLENLFTYLDCVRSHELACRIAKKIYDPSAATFWTGQCDAWRAEIDELTEALLNEKLARQLAEWGYEE